MVFSKTSSNIAKLKDGRRNGRLVRLLLFFKAPNLRNLYLRLFISAKNQNKDNSVICCLVREICAFKV